MSDVSQFKLPDVGEGLTEAEIVSWKVKVGDTIKVNDVIVEIETAKSLVELPSPYGGIVDGLLVEEGQTVPVGTPIIAVRSGRRVRRRRPSRPSNNARNPASLVAPASSAVPARTWCRRRSRPNRKSGRQSWWGTARARRPGAGHASTHRSIRRLPLPKRPLHLPLLSTLWKRFEQAGHHAGVLAKPPVRKLAKDLGVDLTTVVPSGPVGPSLAPTSRERPAQPRRWLSAHERRARAGTAAPGGADPDPVGPQGDCGGRRPIRFHRPTRDGVRHGRCHSDHAAGTAAAGVP